MNTYAEKYNLIVLYPIQNTLTKCWNWFEIAHQRRGSGEPAFIAGATAAVAATYAIDISNVYCAGLSAGGAMTVIMAATYPDVYRGITVSAGLEYKAAIYSGGAYAAMTLGGPDPVIQGGFAYDAMKDYAKWPMKVLVVHGTFDFTVVFRNGQQVTDQWITTDNLYFKQGRISYTPSNTKNEQVPGGYAYQDLEYKDTVEGTVLLHFLKVTGMGHAWSGGDASGSYADPKGPDASLYMLKWFLGVNGGTLGNQTILSGDTK